MFAKLRESKYEDPFGPAKAQFNGAGSYGNGGAMRIAPAGVFGYSMNDTQRLRVNVHPSQFINIHRR